MTVTALEMGPGTLVLGPEGTTRDCSSQVTSITLTPSVDKGDPIPVLSGETIPGDRDETWTLDGTLLQDFGAAESLWEWLFTNRGTSQAFVFIPNNSGERQVSGTVVVEATALGGDVKTKPTADFSFDLVGAPEIADKAA